MSPLEDEKENSLPLNFFQLIQRDREVLRLNNLLNGTYQPSHPSLNVLVRGINDVVLQKSNLEKQLAGKIKGTSNHKLQRFFTEILEQQKQSVKKLLTLTDDTEMKGIVAPSDESPKLKDHSKQQVDRLTFDCQLLRKSLEESTAREKNLRRRVDELEKNLTSNHAHLERCMKKYGILKEKLIKYLKNFRVTKKQPVAIFGSHSKGTQQDLELAASHSQGTQKDLELTVSYSTGTQSDHKEIEILKNELEQMNKINQELRKINDSSK